MAELVEATLHLRPSRQSVIRDHLAWRGSKMHLAEAVLSGVLPGRPEESETPSPLWPLWGRDLAGRFGGTLLGQAAGLAAGCHYSERRSCLAVSQNGMLIPRTRWWLLDTDWLPPGLRNYGSRSSLSQAAHRKSRLRRRRLYFWSSF